MPNLSMQQPSLKQKLLQEKSAKLRVSAQRFLSANGGADVVFQSFNPKPTSQQFSEMCVAAKYGPKDTLFAAGSEFALGHIINEMNRSIADFHGEAVQGWDTVDVPDGISVHVPSSLQSTFESGEYSLDDEQFYVKPSVAPHCWGNILLVFVFNKSLMPHLTSFTPNDFQFDADSGLYVENPSRLIGLRIFTDTLLPLEYFPVSPGHGLKPHELKSNEHFTQYIIQVGLVEDFDTLDADAAKHGVKTHERHLASGKVVPVKGHERRNPTYRMSRKANLDEVSHVVYQAYDLAGKLRYIGEGREARPNHVNSGASHNFKLNEHFFLKGPMRVDVIATGLSKSESLAIEYLMIKKHAGSDLWNTKDNEPFA